MIFYFFKAGGIVMIPLLILAITALAITIDKILLFHNLARIPQKLVDIIEKYNFDWKLLNDNLNKLNSKNYYRKFYLHNHYAFYRSEIYFLVIISLKYGGC